MNVKKEWTLKSEHELRCEIPEGKPLVMKLLSGTAEIFGIEMAILKEYNFSDDNIAVFTWYGCVLETSGDCESIYESDTTPMVSYVNTHVQLEAKRDVALANGDIGPKVSIFIVIYIYK
jgi:polyribonucleotide 5'-hydroxyl-kinase